MIKSNICGNSAKIKTPFAKIFVSGTVDKPYYEILYLDTSDGTCHIGFGSYCVEYVFKWLSEEFEIIETEPSADVAPVVHGKWKPVRYTTHCSCGKSYETYHFLCTACNHVAYAQPYGLKYCPHCGAKMDKEANDDD